MCHSLTPQDATFSVAYFGPDHKHPLPHDHHCVSIAYFNRQFSLSLLPWVRSEKAWKDSALLRMIPMPQSCSFSSAIYTLSLGPQQGRLLLQLYSRPSQSSKFPSQPPALDGFLMLSLPSYQATVITRVVHWTLSNPKNCPLRSICMLSKVARKGYYLPPT